jgi:sigma-E factor negative regulatory protein RseC
MISETGKIVAIEAEALWVETVQRSTCSSCAAQKGCGQGLMNKIADGRRNQLRVPLGDLSPERFNIGDNVQLGVPEAALLSGSAVVYLLPLLAMIGGMLLAGSWGGGDAAAAVGALLGFGVGLLGVRVHAYMIRNNHRYQARLLLSEGNVEQSVRLFSPAVDP